MDAKKVTKWILLGLGAGAATAYLAHPDHGKRRRAALVKGAREFLDKAAREGKKSLRDSQHRLAGIVAALQTNPNEVPPSDRVLEQRIRSRMGRVVSHPRKIHVVCDHGVATLWGLAREEEVFPLIEAVDQVSGVTEVADHVEIGKPEELPAVSTDLLKHARDEVRLNWSPAKRLLVGATGAVLAARGWQRKDPLGNALAALGAGMVVRSAMHKHLRATLALTESSPGYQLEKTIRINAPISDLYDFWANPENYPKVFSHVAKVERLGENLYRWAIAGPVGLSLGWEGLITRAVPNTLIEWKSLPGSAIGNFGVVRFDPNYDASTRINIRMFYRPPGGILGHSFAKVLGADAEVILEQDLKRLKYIFENEEFVGDRERARREEAELLKAATT